MSLNMWAHFLPLFAVSVLALVPGQQTAPQPPAQSAPAAVAPQATTVDGAVAHVYKTIGDIELRLHVFSPSGTSADARRPAIVFFFGGGWRQGFVTQFAPQAAHFAQRGMVAIVADYRVAGRHQTSPFEAMADARSAIRWVRTHAGQLGVAPGQIVAAGGSAGGHIALSAAIIDNVDAQEDKSISAKPNAVVLFNPVVDTSQIQLFAGRGQDASPFHHVKAGAPPTIIMHGHADATVPFVTVERYCDKAKGLGNQCQVVGYEGAAHGFFNSRNGEGKWFRETLAEADRFLVRIGYLREPAR